MEDGMCILSGLGFHDFFSSRRRHTISLCDWSSDVCSSDLMDWRWYVKCCSPCRYSPSRESPSSVARPSGGPRSEERRVGKESRSWWTQQRSEKQIALIRDDLVYCAPTHQQL